VACLSEFSKCIGDFFVEYSSKRGLCVILSEGVTRPGEKSSPKRDNVVRPLFLSSFRRGGLA